MSELQLKSKEAGYAIASLGDLRDFEGKIFVKDVMETTGVEISFGSLSEGQCVPFNHKHKQNEEVYIIVKGKGVFTLDGKDYEVASGDVIRIAPEVVRTNRNTGKGVFSYICIQSKAGSLEQYTMTDGIILQ